MTSKISTFWPSLAIIICAIASCSAYTAVHTPPRDQDCSNHHGVRQWAGVKVVPARGWWEGNTTIYWPTTCKDGYVL